jgi:uncharacterized membrane protein HdeD (DUF308 family)
VPIVIVALIAGRVLVPASRADRARRPDPVGAILSLAGLVALTYGLIEAPDRGWTSVATLGILRAAIALLIAFAWEIRRDDPMVPLQVFRNGRFSAASASVMLVFFSLFGALFLLTQILQFVLGYSPLQAGASALPFAFTVGITSPIAAILSKKRGSAKIPVATGLTLMAAGLAVMANSTAGSGLGHYVFATVLMAAGMGDGARDRLDHGRAPRRPGRRRLSRQRHDARDRRGPRRRRDGQRRQLDLRPPGRQRPLPTTPTARATPRAPRSAARWPSPSTSAARPAAMSPTPPARRSSRA